MSRARQGSAWEIPQAEWLPAVKSPSNEAALAHTQASIIKVMIGTPSYDTQIALDPAARKKIGGPCAATAIFAAKIL
jgi:hypothetical protein